MLALDIETVPLAASLAVPFDPSTVTPPANYKSEEAIAKFMEKAADEYAAKRVKECSINPRLGRVLSLAYAFDNDQPACLYATTAADEPDLLRQFWALCLDTQADRLVTWNGGFDLRWLIIRSIANGVSPTVGTSLWLRKYTYTPHCDVKAFLLNEWGCKDKAENMDAWATLCGLPPKPADMDGSKVYPAFLRGEHDRIQQYNMSDVATTVALYHRIQPYL